ncbi:MAG TPA: tripartite tricarboxylate transporter TctB family protein [Ramlibacter sp.]|jgi:putative tricarboxylic transport membrane protein|uniref:tripartite tricarboxylate transporter TctB family protein n=1 Tax=Ramlibacter sp. TaxID=1917967 RepID=UPI002D614851|nr:tripartite tricarboxylate transporter TctB family protein [Ramlibacter sp.]HZY19471.1 tripartite tricarboxylate transporter TctB family protein [Ramlibacter sp.]
MPDRSPSSPRRAQAVVGAGIVLLGLGIAAGAVDIPSGAGYGGVGPNFLPWAVAGVLALCGVLIVREALGGGFRNMEAPSGAARAWWPGLAWVSAGLLANAALITVVGFILSCTLCYLLAVQGLRRATGQAAAGARTLLVDAATGLAIAAPVYWMFTRLLAINLPGLTGTGWL